MSDMSDEELSDNEIDPRDLAEQYKNEANELYRAQQWRKAIALYTKSIELVPDSTIYLSNRAAAYMSLKMYAESLADCEKALEYDPTFLKALMRMAKNLTNLNRMLEAEQVYQRILQQDPGCGAAQEELSKLSRFRQLIQRAIELQNAGQHAQALRFLETAATISDGHYVSILQGKSLVGLKQYERASKLMSTVIQDEPNNSQALYVRGLALYKSGSTDTAKSHVILALKSDPDDEPSRKLLKVIKSLEATKQAGNDAYTQKRYLEAYEYYTQALSIDPENTEYNSVIYRNRAAACMFLDRLEEAANDCTSSIELVEDNLRSFLRRAEIYQKLGRWEEAVRDFEKAKQLGADPSDIRQKLQNAKHQAKLAKRKDYYKILGIDRHANETEIKKAYKRKARDFHPDRHMDKTPEDRGKFEAQFKELTEAHEVLVDVNKRRRYDAGEDLEDMGGMDVNMEDIFASMFGGGVRFGGGGGRRGHGGGHHHHHHHNSDFGFF